ncbi:hypothetical protein HDU97_002953 [Phlyctochytrium planicorne]|nr:hypothetical protein HDU97_002953 [Phlyctochytrium planicorne]
MKVAVSVSAAVLLFLSVTDSVNAHAKITSPSPRAGFSEAAEVFPPCGGGKVNSARTDFPLKGGSFSFTSFHETASIIYEIAISSNPSPADFNAGFGPTSSGQSVTVPRGSTTVSNIDLSSVPGAKDGVQATLRFRFDAGDGVLYDCADVTLRDTSPKPPKPDPKPSTQPPNPNPNPNPTPSPNPTPNPNPEPNPTSPSPSPSQSVDPSSPSTTSPVSPKTTLDATKTSAATTTAPSTSSAVLQPAQPTTSKGSNGGIKSDASSSVAMAIFAIAAMVMA